MRHLQFWMYWQAIVRRCDSMRVESWPLGKGNDRAPIVFVPGLGGTSLEIMRPDEETVLNPYTKKKTLCESTKPKYETLWLKLPSAGDKIKAAAQKILRKGPVVSFGRGVRSWSRKRKDNSVSETTMSPCWYHSLTLGMQNDGDDGADVEPLYGTTLGFIEPSVQLHRGFGGQKDENGTALTKPSAFMPGVDYLQKTIDYLSQHHAFKPMTGSSDATAGLKDDDDDSRLEDPVLRGEFPDLFVAAYDFRRGDMKHINRYHSKLRELVERAYFGCPGSVRGDLTTCQQLRANNKLNQSSLCGRKVLLVGHSLGGVHLGWFLRRMQGTDPDWVDKFIGGATFIGAPFGGAAAIVRSIIVGEDMGQGAIFSDRMMKSALRTYATSYWLADASRQGITLVDPETGQPEAVDPENLGELVKSALLSDPELDLSDPVVDAWAQRQIAEVDRAFDEARNNLGFPKSFLSNTCEPGVAQTWVEKALCAVPQVPMFFAFASGGNTGMRFAMSKKPQSQHALEVPRLKNSLLCKVPGSECLFNRTANACFTDGQSKNGKCFANMLEGPFGDGTVTVRSALLPFDQWEGQTGPENPLCSIHSSCAKLNQASCHKDLITDPVILDKLVDIATAIFEKQHGRTARWPSGPDVKCEGSAGASAKHATAASKPTNPVKSKSKKCCQCEVKGPNDSTHCKAEGRQFSITEGKCEDVCRLNGAIAVQKGGDEKSLCDDVFEELWWCFEVQKSIMSEH